MKALVLKFSFITVLLMTVISVSAQNNATIHFKTMTIHNGDTIVKEQNLPGDGSTFISDSLFDNNTHFLYFNNDFNLDTNFNDNFSESFSNEMKEFLKQFSFPSGNMFGQGFDNFGFDLPIDMDSMFRKNFPSNGLPGDSINNNFVQPQTNFWYPYSISCDNMVSVFGPVLDNYSTEPDLMNGTLKVSFSLDALKPTLIRISNSKNKTVYKEKLRKSSGLYTRLFDLSVYEPGKYFLTITQGKKQNKSILTFSKNR